MKDAGRHMEEIIGRIRLAGCVLMLDFDGVLSPLVNEPAAARLPLGCKRELQRCAAKMPVAIITGRPLEDIEQRVGLMNIHYAGCHGLEWRVHGRRHYRPVSADKLRAFAVARDLFLQLARRFPRLAIEDKRQCLALGYRSLSELQKQQFLDAAREAVKELPAPHAPRILDNQGTFEVLVDSEWTKGDCAKLLYHQLTKETPLPVYIGDSLTDEDAFRALATGITIRVGQDPGSAAQYYFSSRRSVAGFLQQVASSA